jgi:hypothetical protein
MKTTLCLFLFLAGAALARSPVFEFDLSPPGTSAGVGLSPLNEVIFTPSMGSGNEIGMGITFDTNTLMLTLNLGYGSAGGFTDLTGPAFSWLLHGPALPSETAPVVFDLAALHTFAGDPARGGTISGSLALTPAQASDLFAGLDYINVYTPANLGGEIRGQLVLIPEPGTMGLLLMAGAILSGWRLGRRRW